MKALHILFIGDEDGDHDAIREYAESLGWFASSTSCDDGWDKVQVQSFDAILVDSACLPSIRALRTMPGPNHQTPVVVVRRMLADDDLAEWQAELADVMVQEPLLLSTFKDEILRLVAN